MAKCPECGFKNDTPVIDHFMAKTPFVLRDIWYRHFGSHVGFEDKAPQRFVMERIVVDYKLAYIAIMRLGLINEMV